MGYAGEPNLEAAQKPRVAPGLAYDGGLPAYLFLHGFTATPEELRFLAESVFHLGHRALVPLLPGHGDHPAALAKTRWIDWYRAAESGAVTLGAENAPIVVVGQSLGGLLALHLAACQPQWVRCLVLLAPAIFLQAWWVETFAAVLPLLARIRPYWPKNSSDIADPEARAQRVGYNCVPLRAVSELVRLQQLVRAQVHRVCARTLIVQSKLDHTCLWEGVKFLKERLSGPVELLVLERSFHVVSLDYERELVARTMHQFVAACCSNP